MKYEIPKVISSGLSVRRVRYRRAFVVPDASPQLPDYAFVPRLHRYFKWGPRCVLFHVQSFKKAGRVLWRWAIPSILLSYPPVVPRHKQRRDGGHQLSHEVYHGGDTIDDSSTKQRGFRSAHGNHRVLGACPLEVVAYF